MRATTIPMLASLAACCVMSACATRTYDREQDQQTFRGAMEEPLRDLSLVRQAPPPLLAAAAEAPFRLPADADCETIMREIADLDTILGPDIDTPAEDDGDNISATELLTGAIGGVWSLPYRSIVRRVTGANRRERTLRQAILAGMVRRGFLKGAAQRAGCSPASPNSASDQQGENQPGEDAP